MAPLAEECFRSGIPEEEAVFRTLRHFNHHKDEAGLRATFRNVYSEMKGFGKRPSITREQDTSLRLEEFLKRRYEICYNSMTDEVEYRERNSTRFRFSTLDKRARNSIAISALKEGIQAWDRDIDRFLHSDYIPVYNPVEKYLYEVGEWDGHDRIRELADRVICQNPHWRELFYRWFLSMVANWLGRDKQHGNATTPILIGPQGYRKSTFCRILLPPDPRFGYTNSLDFSIPSSETEDGEWLMTVDVFNYIQGNVREKLPIGKLTHLGRLLKKWNVPNKRTEKGSFSCRENEFSTGLTS